MYSRKYGRNVINESKILNESVIYTELPINTSSLPQPLKKSVIKSHFRNDIENIFNDYVGGGNVDTATQYVYGTRLDSGTPLRFVANRKVDKGTLMRAGSLDWKDNYGGKNYWLLKTTLLRIKDIFSTKITFEEVIVSRDGNQTLRFDTKSEMKDYINNLINDQNKRWEQKKNSQPTA